MTEGTVGSAAPGLFFDIEATACDIVVSGIEIATEETDPVEFAVYVCERSWLDDTFATIQDAKAWRCVMLPKVLRLENNPLELLDDGNVRLTWGKYSPLPLDETIPISKGRRMGFYIHGRDAGAVVFRHPVWDLAWGFEEAELHHGMIPEEEMDECSVVNYRYEKGHSRCVLTDEDDCIRVYAGTNIWDTQPFSMLNPLTERDEPDEHTAAAFCGVITYHRQSSHDPENKTSCFEIGFSLGSLQDD